MIEHSWNQTNFSMVTERIAQVIVRINTRCNKSKAMHGVGQLVRVRVIIRPNSRTMQHYEKQATLN